MSDRVTPTTSQLPSCRVTARSTIGLTQDSFQEPLGTSGPATRTISTTLSACHQNRASWPARGRNDAIHAQILDHLSVVVKSMRQGLHHQCQASYLRAFQRRDRRGFNRCILLS